MDTSPAVPADKAVEFTAHSEPVSCSQFLDHDRLIVTGSHDKTIAIWTCNGTKLHTLQGHTHRVVSLSVDELSNRLLSASWDRSITLWDTHSLDRVWTGHHETVVTTCHTAPDHHLAVAGCDNGHYYLWDTRTKDAVATIEAHTNTITCCRFSCDGVHLCSCSMDNTTLVWDIRSHKRLLKLTDHANVVSGCSFSPNGHHLATCSWDKSVLVYDVALGGYRSQGPVVLTGHEGCASACDLSRDGTMLVSCGYNHDIRIWNTNTFQLKATYRGYEGWIEDVHFGESSSYIISCGQNGTVRVWPTTVPTLHNHEKEEPKHTAKLITCSKCRRDFSYLKATQEMIQNEEQKATTKDSTCLEDPPSGSHGDSGTNTRDPLGNRTTQQTLSEQEEREKQEQDEISAICYDDSKLVYLCVFCRPEPQVQQGLYPTS